MVASALEEACGINRAKIREMYNNFGDLGTCYSIISHYHHSLCIVIMCMILNLIGDVAQECRKTQSLLLPPSPLLIRDVFSILRKIR